MSNSIYIGLSRQMALRTNMDIIANNVANISTPGFRGQNTLFQEYVSDPKGVSDPLSFVFDQGQYQMTKPGSVAYTGNPLDIALEGPGFIGVTGPGGEQTFTRAGNFLIGADGTLQTPEGFAVSSLGGGAIVLPDDSTEISIDNKGIISNQDGELGQIMVHEFNNVQGLQPIGNNLYRSPDDPGAPSPGTVVKQAHLEGSNVNAVLEMTRMIETLRSYQSAQTVLRDEHERIRTTIQRLTRG